MKRTQLLLALALAAAAPAFAAGGHEHHHHAHGHAHAAGPAKKEQTDWGIAADAKAARRTIRVTMTDDMRFSPAIIEVGEGETVKLVVHNAGKAQHEMVLGTPKEIREHAALMTKFPGMEHDEAHMTHVAPGQTGSIAWTFNRPGEFQFACLVPGHFQAGMTGTIRVLPAADHKD